MKKGLIILVVVIVVVLAIVGYLWSAYNKMVTANENIDGQWAQVETQYQRRFELIPGLVESVKGVLGQEQKVFGDLAEARTRYGGAVTVDQKVAAATEVESVLGRLLMIMENYPQLKSAENVQTLMAQLEGTENRVSVERGRFNDLVKNYNILIKKIPEVWIAGMFGFGEKQYFEAAAGAENAPSVNLNINQ